MLTDALRNPDATVPLDRLAEAWSAAVVEAVVPGHGALAGDLVVMNRIRGALGAVLMEQASAEALAGRPCPWSPPCALDVLFREQARLGKHGLPKPWVLALDARGFDLVVRVTLFGYAIDWAGVAAHALVAALRGRIDWRERAPDLFLPAPQVERLEVREVSPPLVPPPRPLVTLDFITPLDAAGDDPLDRPATVIGRLARRVDLLVRWMGFAIDADWPALADHWRGLDYDASALSRRTLERRSGRQHRDFRHDMVAGALVVAGDLAPLWPLLLLGQSCHVGRAATAGLGRYRLG